MKVALTGAARGATPAVADLYDRPAVAGWLGKQTGPSTHPVPVTRRAPVRQACAEP